VGVAQALVQPASRDLLVRKSREENQRRRDRHAKKDRLVPQLALSEARNNRHRCDWNGYRSPAPQFTGTKILADVDLDMLRNYIDWMPFFNAWQFRGTYPAIMTDPIVGEAARNLFADASAMLDRIVREKWLQAKAVFGFFPANSIDDDDICFFSDSDRMDESMRLCHLRQQKTKPQGHAHNCLADYVAPASSGLEDYVGAFAVSAGFGIDEHVRQFEKANDDYSSIILKALADRLAEALAEYLHESVRKQHWGYASEEHLSGDQLIAERYSGIRPAPGYPACPDHTEKSKLWALLDAENAIGLRLTESFAMFPTAAVSGFYFSHPDSKYFAVGQIGRDQVESFAARKKLTLAEAERWLAPNLGYEPDEADAA
jgi:5-methyltetrahydrofolate--homocysteine methyltransferase